jgi:cytochrome d ubiquinol oxidase subunit II
VWAYLSARAGFEGRAFTGIALFLAFGAASIFAAVFPVVLPSTIDPAFNLTIANAASGSYTLGVMTWVTAFSLPIILGYQAWSYWVFRKRVGDNHLPTAHPVRGPIVRSEVAGK